MNDADRKPVVTVLTAPDEDTPPGLEPLSGLAEVRWARDAESLAGALPGSEVLVVTDFRTGVLGHAWPKADKLRWIHATSAGVDAVLIPEVRESDVVLTNAQGIFNRSIAEYVLGAILMWVKDFHGSLRLQQKHQWKHRDTGRALGERVLVVGAGAIGREIARVTAAIGMEVHGIAREGRDSDPDFRAVHGNDALHEQLSLADHVVVAAPLTSGTRGMFDARAFEAMRESALFINIGRGPIVCTDDLVGALRRKRIAGAALDVFEEEPLPPEHPLWAMDNVLITAHMAGDFIGWRAALSEQFLENLARWQRGEELFNVVNKELGYVPGN